LQTALACREIAAEKLGIWHADLKSIQSVLQADRAERVARSELFLDQIRQEVRRDEQMLRQWSGRRVKDDLDTPQPEVADLPSRSTCGIFRTIKRSRRQVAAANLSAPTSLTAPMAVKRGRVCMLPSCPRLMLVCSLSTQIGAPGTPRLQ
jgi:hypothetical protein